MPKSWSELIKAAGPAVGGLMLFTWGCYGLQVVKNASPPFDYYAGWVCVSLTVAGAVIAVIVTAFNAIRACPE